MDSRAWAANNLAASLLAGSWTPEALAAAIDAALGPIHHRTRGALVTRLVALGRDRAPPSPSALRAHLIGSDFFRPLGERPVATVLSPPRFAPVGAFSDLDTPPMSTVGELAKWLGLTPVELDWLADARQTHRSAVRAPLQHYHYAFLEKRGGKTRLVEAPKSRLKAVQRRILREILRAVPVHDCAHGFVEGRSCLSGAQVHAGETLVATFDMAQFFPSIGVARVRGLFRSLGYPWAVARSLAGLCTTVTPASVFLRQPAAQRPDWQVQALHRTPHLPQGAPTSPALANLLAWRLDRRLHGLARAVEANYTRYADDMAFSGQATFASQVGRLKLSVEKIVREEGFGLNAAKTRFMPDFKRQRVTGIVVNAHCNTSRADFDTLKAILHNCARAGPAGQNHANIADFRRHLDGRVNWVEQVNPARGAKLRRLYDMIDWSSAAPPI